jgi:hypothetical protein
MHDNEQTNYNPMDEDKAFEGVPHLWKSKLYVDEITQLDVHWAI